MMSDVLIVGGLSVNTMAALGLSFTAGKYAQRVKTVESRVATLEEVKAEVTLATLATDVRHLSGLVQTIQEELHAIAKLIARSHTGFSEAAGD